MTTSEVVVRGSLKIERFPATHEIGMALVPIAR
ncbi:MAG: hypothetical protein JWN40_4934 [Phycisphaerales bacterium]|nr:hypothetical protein [Phycisphaerales bacterium]